MPRLGQLAVGGGDLVARTRRASPRARRTDPRGPLWPSQARLQSRAWESAARTRHSPRPRWWRGSRRTRRSASPCTTRSCASSSSPTRSRRSTAARRRAPRPPRHATSCRPSSPGPSRACWRTCATPASRAPASRSTAPPTPRPGELRTWVAGFYPIELDGRRLVGVVVVDVTDRRRAQEALRESEAVLSGAQRMAGVGWWTLDRPPEIRRLRARAARPHGPRPRARRHAAAARPGSSWPTRRSCARFRGPRWIRRRPGRPFARRMRARRADGRAAPARRTRRPRPRRRTASPIGLQGFVQDITELARAEQRQRAVAELGQQALEDLDIDALMQRAVDARRAARSASTASAALELLPGGERARLRAAPAPAGSTAHGRSRSSPHGVIDRALDDARSPSWSATSTTARPADGGARARRAGARSVVAVVIDGRARSRSACSAAMSRAAAPLPAEDDTLPERDRQRARRRRRARAPPRREIADISAARGRLVAQAIDAEDRARRGISEALHDGALQELLAVRNELFALAGRGGDEDGARRRAGARSPPSSPTCAR